MKTRNNLSKNDDKKAKKSKPFWSFMGGDFLLKEAVVRWYPFLLILFISAILIAKNEASIAAKEEQITEYKKKSAEVKTDNRSLRDGVPPEIMTLIEAQGFVRKDSATFKIIMNKTNKPK